MLKIYTGCCHKINLAISEEYKESVARVATGYVTNNGDLVYTNPISKIWNRKYNEFVVAETKIAEYVKAENSSEFDDRLHGSWYATQRYNGYTVTRIVRDLIAYGRLGDAYGMDKRHNAYHTRVALETLATALKNTTTKAVVLPYSGGYDGLDFPSYISLLTKLFTGIDVILVVSERFTKHLRYEKIVNFPRDKWLG